MRAESDIQRRPTIKLIDVAQRAGVSLATASRAMSNPELVRAATLEKVRLAAEALGYVPHGAARALASQRTRTIGAVFPPVDNPIFATGTRALARELSKAGYTLLLATHNYDDNEELAAVRRLVERGVDGIVLVGNRHLPQLHELLGQAGVPYEFTWSLDESEQHFCVGIDHLAAAARITDHLLELGHREFAMISGTLQTNDRADKRMRGVVQALATQSLVLRDDRVIQVEFGYDNGRRALATLLRTAPGFTALICANDMLAVGALHACSVRSIKVPDELSVVGFDDIDIAPVLTPGLTTIRVPSAEIGRLAAVRLLARLAGRSVKRCESLPYEVIQRASTGPAPGRGLA